MNSNHQTGWATVYQKKKGKKRKHLYRSCWSIYSIQNLSSLTNKPGYRCSWRCSQFFSKTVGFHFGYLIPCTRHGQSIIIENEGIHITAQSKAELLEECLLSLFEKLQSNRQQNQRSLKSTLRTAWKMGSDLRIVEVDNGILQFKFSSQYQMEWVEKNGPWNFDNNLLLC